MALNRIECPECGAGLKSSEGFAPGESVDCPKCETSFTVRAATDDAPDDDAPKKKRKKKARDDEGERGYKNSPMRYVVLGVLVAVMIVLGVLLVRKKQQDREIEEANAKITERENGGEPPRFPGPGGGGPKNVGPDIVGLTPKNMGPTPKNIGPVPKNVGPIPNNNGPFPKASNPTGGNGILAETPYNGTPEFTALMTRLRQKLAGTWEGAAPDGTIHKVTYQAGGQFTMDVGGKTTSGTWQAVGLVGGKVLKISRGTATAYKVAFEGDELIHDTDTAGVSLVMKKK